jgi:succinate dehydrogenase/fumarate reductase flavoprotein subunit
MNMEFMQIFFCIPHPTRNLFHAWEGQELGAVYNTEGHRFLADYLPPGITVEECVEENLKHAPFSTRDRASRFLAIAMVKEVQAGRGTEHGAVYFDHPKPRSWKERAQLEFFRYRGIDPTSEPIELTMGHQCSDGGFRIHTDGMTTIPGVFAAGEVTTGMHGADRIGGNMLANGLIFGARAGKSAVRWARQNGPSARVEAKTQLERIRSVAARNGSTPPAPLLEKLKASAWDNALTIRSERSLKSFLACLESLARESKNSMAVETRNDLISALELDNLLVVGEAVGQAALMRNESRGGHYREDFPERNTSDIPKAILLSRDEQGRLAARRDIVDPDWSETDAAIGNERWG